MRDRFADTRYEVWSHARKMWEAGLVVGSSGNVSTRIADDPSFIAITPTSITYEEMSAQHIVIVDLLTGQSLESREQPSYELPMHRVIYREMPHVAAIVHTHSPFVTTLSVLRRPLPPVIDEMMLRFGGQIEVADYASSGTEDLGRHAVAALGKTARGNSRQSRKCLCCRKFVRGAATGHLHGIGGAGVRSSSANWRAE